MKIKQEQSPGLYDGLIKAELDLLIRINRNKDTGKPVQPKKGDILGLNRKLIGIPYEHYEVYVGKSKVIHYTSLNHGLNLDLQIAETSFKDFLKSNNDFFILNFDHLKNPIKSEPIPIYKLSNVFCPNCTEFLKVLMEIREWKSEKCFKNLK